MTDTTNQTPVPAALIETMRHAKAQIETWTEISKIARAQLEALLGDNEIGTVDDQPVVRWPHVKTTRIDQTVLKAEYPEAYANSQTTVVSRRLSLVDPS